MNVACFSTKGMHAISWSPYYTACVRDFNLFFTFIFVVLWNVIQYISLMIWTINTVVDDITIVTSFSFNEC